MTYRNIIYSAIISVVVLCVADIAHGQAPYAFHCRDYVSTDDNRAPQSAFTYDDKANSFTINALPGENNIAFEMNRDKDNAYYITNDCNWMVITGSNVSVETEKSKMWFWNGLYNNPYHNPNYVIEKDGRTVMLWNIKEDFSWSSNLFAGDQVYLSANGGGYINAVGLTPVEGTIATIHDVAYYNVYKLATEFPELLSPLGYTAESMTLEIKTIVEKNLEKARSLNPKEGSTLKQEIERAEDALRNIKDTDYQLLYPFYESLPGLIEEYIRSNAIISYEKTDNGILARWNDDYLRLMFYSDDIVRIYKSKKEAVDKRSLSVVAMPAESINFDVVQDGNVLTVQGDKLTIQYDMDKMSFSIYRADGSIVIAEKDFPSTFKETKDGIFDSYNISNHFKLDKDEYIFGMGQIQNGTLNQRGQSHYLEQLNMKVCIPYFQSSKNYSLFWDNYSSTTFTDNNISTSFTSLGTEIDYYVMVGDSSDEVLSLMRNLTGSSPMPALWNFGLYQSKQRYGSANEVMEVVKKYRDLKVPLDCIVQDWQYWGGNEQWNAMEFLNPSFSNYQEMIDFVHANNTKLMISVWANFAPATVPFKELNSNNMLLSAYSFPWGCGVQPYDVYSKEARNIYWKHLYNGLASKGIDAYWLDCTEPDYSPMSGDSDFDFVTGDGRTWRSLRNAFPLATVSGVYDNHRATEALGDNSLSGKRTSILTRSAFAGQQRYGANTWSGDITANWGTLANQIPAACNLSATGIPYWNSDIGAFYVGDYEGGVNNPDWRRLYMRWTQFACFTPMMRFHGDGTPREIYQFGSENDGIGDYDNILKYIKLRYRLLPYLYSTAWQVCSNDRTFMQALPLAFNDDRNGYDVKDEYMFGESFLVAPVIADRTTRRNVYLPAGHKWINFWTGKSYDGGRSVSTPATSDIIPLYVKAGSIIPWGPDVQYSNEKKWDNLEIRVYPGADGSFTLYEDENDGYEYEKGQYTEIEFSWNDAERTLTIGARNGSFPGMLQTRKFNICKVSMLRGFGDAHTVMVSAQVEYDGKEITVVLDDEDPEQPEYTDVTAEYIVNPSFEINDTEGWTVDAPTAWNGVNVGGGWGDPEATDGSHIFGVWDWRNDITAKISQSIILPAGKYILTVDMHAPNRETGECRVGNQRLFANENVAYFKDQIDDPGASENFPMQTLELRFSTETNNTNYCIGVATDGAPNDTWFKIDNFRLYMMPASSGVDNVIVDTVNDSQTFYYNLMGHRVMNPVNGNFYIKKRGSKVEKIIYSDR